MRPASPVEERVCRALRQANAITAAEFRAAMDALEATENCDRCDASGVDPSAPPGGPPLACAKCDGSGQMRTLR